MGERRTEPDASFPEELLERYTVEDTIGAGGTSVVYRVVERASGRVLALKRLAPSPSVGRRAGLDVLFDREYRTLARLRHPGIVEVHDFGLTKTGPYYTMELLGGRELAARVPLPFETVCRYLAEIASALSLLHAHRLVHRDVTSRNIRITEDDHAKLIDFGALTSFGVAAEVVGTAAYLAPEVLREMPLDHRVDLYSLGAAGYFALTGRHPYPARNLRELPEVWKTEPPPPSAFVPGIPPELDRLVLSLLAADALERPANAAEVIDQLTTIGGLPPDLRRHAEEAYLLSSPMVGRAVELERCVRRLNRASGGGGGEILVEGAAGLGKTRLLDELSLACQPKGAIPLRADGEREPHHFGVATALVASMLRAIPELSRRAAGENAPLLAHLSPLVAGQLGAEPGPLSDNPQERRARLQTALHDWFGAVTREQTLAVIVDNVHAADDSSAAFLAALGHGARQGRLLLVVTQRTDTPVVAEAPVRTLRERSARIVLRSLDAEACTELACALFGDVANTTRVGRLLFERSLGVPRACLDLATLMVERRIAKYVSGTWVLPLDVSPDELPDRIEEIVAARLDRLSADARTVLELLAIHEKPVSHALLRTLTGSPDPYRAIDELAREDLLVSDGDTNRFRQQTARTAVYEAMDPERRRAGHLAVANALLDGANGTAGARIDAALHLLAGGEQTRAATLLVSAAREFVARSGTHDAPDQAARALHAMTGRYDAEGRSDHELGALLFPLMPLAYYTSHFRYVLEHGERAMAIGLRISGLARAAELAPALGREAALAQGLEAGAEAFAAQPAIPGYDLAAAIGSSLAMVPAVTGTAATCLDIDLVKRLGERVEPLLLFGEGHVAALMHEFAIAEVLTVQGRETAARRLWQHQLAAYRDPKVAGALGEGHARSLQGAALFNLGIVDTYRFGPAALETARSMEALGVRTWAMAADQVRLLYHAFRGESEPVEKYRRRVDLYATQGGTTWQAEMFWPMLLLNADFLSWDTISSRRTADQLARRAREVPCLVPYAEAAQAAYLFLRGEVGASVKAYDAVLPLFAVEERVGWETTRAFFAAALNAAGEHARAREVAREVTGRCTEEHRLLALRFLEAEQQLARAEAGLGHHEEAARILDALVERHGREDNALLVGRLHHARSDVARLAGDDARAREHGLLMAEHFRRTRNPALIAQCDGRLRGADHRVRREDTVGLATEREAGEWVSLLTEEIGSSADPWRAALDLIVQRTRATAGYLYVLELGAVRLVAASQPSEPPLRVELDLAQRLRTFQDDDDHAGNTEVLDAASPARPDPAFQAILLTAAERGSRVALGGALLEMPAQNALRLTPALLEAVSRVLRERRSADAEPGR